MLELLIIFTLLVWGSADFIAARASRLAPTITLMAWAPLASIPVAAIAAGAGLWRGSI